MVHICVNIPQQSVNGNCEFQLGNASQHSSYKLISLLIIITRSSSSPNML